MKEAKIFVVAYLPERKEYEVLGTCIVGEPIRIEGR